VGFVRDLMLATIAGCALAMTSCAPARHAVFDEPGPAGNARAARRALEALFTELHDRGHFNGAVVVGSGDEIIYEGGFGFANVAEGVRFTPDTPTWCASIAKTFTAAGILMLVEEGLIELDEPVATSLPGLPYPRVTVRHLLAHTSGLLPTSVYVTSVDTGDRTRTNDLLLEIIAEQRPPLPFEPGSAFQYSNAAYDLAALLIERVSGESYSSFLEGRIFEPLSLSSTFLRPPWNRDWEKGPRTLSYHKVGDEWQARDVPDNDANYGSNGIYSSVRDLNRWAASFCAAPVLSESALKIGLDAPPLGDEHRSALNLLCWYYSQTGERSYFTGDGRGFYTFVYWDADSRISIVWATNRPSPVPPPALSRAIIDIMAGRPFTPVEPPELAPLNLTPTAWPSLAELATLASEWELDDGRRLTIGMQDGVDDLRLGWPLLVRIDDGPRYHIFPGGDMLYVPGLDGFAWFTEDDGERTNHWSRVFEGTTSGTSVQ
jgi:CubicO group peptidase (beta-lactamase class C family)